MHISTFQKQPAFRGTLLTGLLLLVAGLAAQTTFTEADVISILSQEADLRLSTTDVAELEITSQYHDDRQGLTHVYAQQHIQGVPVKTGTAGLHFDAAGNLLHLTSKFVPNVANKINSTTPSLSAAAGLSNALSALGLSAGNLTVTEQTGPNAFVFDKGAVSTWDIPVRLVAEADENGNQVLAWESRVYAIDQQNYWEISVDAASGLELARVDRVISCSFEREEGHAHEAGCHAAKAAVPAAEALFSAPVAAPGANFYRVYAGVVEAPSFGDRTLEGTAGDAAASPLGWHDDGLVDYNITKGNNVYAYQDPGPGSTGIPTVGGLPGQKPLVFDFDAPLELTPANYRDAAITNLFYWNNKIHDDFYHYGFTEAAGNFQQNNFGKGGEDLDGVLAEAQDGSGVNNANMLTLEDGLPGRMQMFLWAGVPIIDGDFDNGVILHEYGHGISTRLTGGPAATCLGGDEQGGEGWSDFFGMLFTMRPETVPGIFATGRGLGTYVLGEGTDGDGIRPARYSTDFTVNDYTYGDLTRDGVSAPHGVGFIWATMLWELTANLVDAYGYDDDLVFGTGGNNIALQLVMTGLTLQPCSPTFVEQRDAILAADQLLNGGANKCLIWEAFAKRGLGFSAVSGTNTRGDEIEAFDVPASLCTPTVSLATTVDGLVTDGQPFNVKLSVSNNSGSTINGVTVTNQLPLGTSVVSASRAFSVNNGTVTFSNVSVAPESTLEIDLVLEANTGSAAAMLFRDDMEDNPFNWTADAGVNSFGWTTADAFSGNYAWFAADPNNFSNQILTLNETVDVVSGTHVRFAHRFNTEADFDGGRVEVSNDGGTTWTDAGPLFADNGYNDLVTAADNPLINGFCFAGSSGGFIHSLVDLSVFAGQSVQVRFRFASDVATAAEGWYIDDLEVVNDPFLIENVAGFSMNGGFTTGTATNEILVLNGASSRGVETGDRIAPDALVNTTEEVRVGIVPNPAVSNAALSLSGVDSEAATLTVVDAQGREIYRRQDVATNGSQINLNVAGWPAGLYVVRFQWDDQVKTEKLIVE